MARSKSSHRSARDGQARAAAQPVNFQIEGPLATNACVVHIEFSSRSQQDGAERSPDSRLAEVVQLAMAIDLTIVGQTIVSCGKLHPSTLLGRGKVSELAAMVAASDAELVIVNAQLSPVQQRNLEKAWDAKVLDRTGLILEIFGRRARTREGTLQVELAHLDYQKSRLVRSWTHLERQRGGSGFLGGPGETQLEADRRVIQQRITKLKKQLSSVARTRGLHRYARARVPYPVIALVGYTNAGKSTLFNRLTGADVEARDLLFATLDPTMRQIGLLHGRKAILSDTVGFIADLPTQLVAAFRATLEEVCNADLILHVRDMSHPEAQAQSDDVHQVLNELGLDADSREQMIEVWNKADLVSDDELQSLLAQSGRSNGQCSVVSAVTGQGVAELLAAIEQQIANAGTQFEIELAPADGKDAAWLYRYGEVIERTDQPDGTMRFQVRFETARIDLATRRFGGRMHKLARRSTKPENPIAAE